MTVRTFIKHWWFFLLSFAIAQFELAAPAPEPTKVNEIDYDITVRIDPTNRTFEGKSVITVKRPKALRLLLGAAFEVTHAFFNVMHHWALAVNGAINRIPGTYHSVLARSINL